MRSILRHALTRRPTVITAAAMAATLVAGVASPANAAQQRPAALSGVAANIAADADWLLQGQLPDGAIAWYIDKGRISPYLGNYAAIGLAEAAKQTGRGAYADAAWSWLRWYAAHQDTSGFVTDYNIDAAGVETSTGDEDSTDAYAGTFLSAARAAYLVDPSKHRLRPLHGAINAAVGAIEATQDDDGLTWAKPAWHVKYLMDQAEVYNGLLSAADLASDLHDGALRRRSLADAEKLAAGVASLWNPTTGAYDWAKHDDGATVSADWGVLYSDSMEQAWIASSAAVDPARAGQLVGELEQAQPDWSQPAALADINGSLGPVGYWPVAGWALLRVGQASDAAAAAASIRARALDAGRAWPFTTGNAGQLIVLESGDTALIAP